MPNGADDVPVVKLVVVLALYLSSCHCLIGSSLEKVLNGTCRGHRGKGK